MKRKDAVLHRSLESLSRILLVLVMTCKRVVMILTTLNVHYLVNEQDGVMIDSYKGLLSHGDGWKLACFISSTVNEAS